MYFDNVVWKIIVHFLGTGHREFAENEKKIKLLSTFKMFMFV